LIAQTKAACWVCGRRARRHCLAAAKPICPTCCGSKRGLEIKCTADCEFYPFGVAGYDLWLKLDDAVLPKLMSRVAAEFGQHHVQGLVRSLAGGAAGALRNEEFALYSALHICFSVELDKNGRTLADRWRAEGWAGLKLDEALLMQCRSKSFVTVVEVERVLDHQRVECLDLFSADAAPFVIVDRSLARTVVRFTRMLGWLTHYPNFSKIGHVSLVVPELIRREFVDLIEGLRPKSAGPGKGASAVRDATSGGVTPEGGASREAHEAAVKQAMLEHLADLTRAVAELPGEKMRSILRSMDVWHCTGFYRLNAPQEDVIRVLDAKPDFDWVDQEPEEGDPPGVEHYYWRRLGESQEFERGLRGVFRHEPGSAIVGGLGNLKVGCENLVFETFARAKYEFGKKMIEKYFGGMVTFEREDAVDLARKVAESHEGRRAGDADQAESARTSPIPPEVQAQAARDYFLSHYTKFLDDTIPALDGLSPRQAAKDPSARPLLLELMKEHICGIETDNRERGFDINISFVLRELGLDELL